MKVIFNLFFHWNNFDSISFKKKFEFFILHYAKRFFKNNSFDEIILLTFLLMIFSIYTN